LYQEREIELAEMFLKHRRIGEYKALYNLYYKSLCFFAYGYLKDHQEAEDAVQETFIRIWEGKSDIQRAEKLGGYLYATVRNHCLNTLRQRKTQAVFQAHELAQVDNTWEEDESLRMIKSEVYREIMQTIEKLPPKMQEVFKLSYLSQLREEEIAQRLSISVNSVKTHKQRAKKILREDLKQLFSLVLIFHL